MFKSYGSFSVHKFNQDFFNVSSRFTILDTSSKMKQREDLETHIAGIAAEAR